jgi:hypothetical protein
MGSRKVAFVTGASRGIGRAIALDLARHGFDIAAAARSVDKSVVDWAGTVEETCARVRDFGQRGLPVKLDLTELDDVRRAVTAVMSEFGRIDVVVTSATNIDFAPDGTYLNEFVATSWEALERHIKVNITSSMLLLHLVLPIMYEQGSGIVMSVTQASAWLDFPELPMPGQGLWHGDPRHAWGHRPSGTGAQTRGRAARCDVVDLRSRHDDLQRLRTLRRHVEGGLPTGDRALGAGARARRDLHRDMRRSIGLQR